MDVKDVTMVFQVQDRTATRWMTWAHREDLTVKMRLLLGRCKAITVHTEVETLVGREHPEKEKLLETVVSAAEQWAKECLGNGVRDEGKKKLRVRHRLESDYR